MQHFLYVIGQLGLGGAERQLSYLTGELQRRGYRVAVAVWNYCAGEAYVELLRRRHIAVLPVAGAHRWQKIAALRRHAEKMSCQVLHSYSFYTNIVAALASIGRPWVSCGAVRSNFAFEVGLRHGLGRLCAVWPRTQIYNSAAAANTASSQPRWLRPRHCVVVRNAVDLQRFTPHAPVAAPPWVLLGVGTLLPYKRWDLLLDAVALLRHQGHPVILRLAGDGPAADKLRAQARALNLVDVVQFVGALRDVPRALAEAHVLVHTSEVEGCPNVVMEALAAGRPVVAMAAGDIPFLLRDRRVGRVVNLGDITGFAHAVKEVLAGDLTTMGQQARAVAERDYGVNRLVDETLAAYRLAGWRG